MEDSCLTLSLIWQLVIFWLSATGLVGFVMMGLDKARAQDRSRRIPEKLFFRVGLAGGVFGILVGSSVFHHKTLKGSFMSLISIEAIAWVLVLIALLMYVGPPSL
jgi:uncharacterized membrane protein YsdA (DUF1294 family)